MEHKQLERELDILTELMKIYEEYNLLKSDNNTNIIEKYQIEDIYDLIEKCFIEDTHYLEHKIEDMIFFLNELKILEVIKDEEFVDYDRRARLKYLYESEYQSLKRHLKIYHPDTKYEIELAITDSEITNYFPSSLSIKEYRFICDILECFSEYNNSISESEIFARIGKSSKEKTINAFVTAISKVIPYYEIKEDQRTLLSLQSKHNHLVELFDIKREKETVDKEFTIEYIDRSFKYRINGIVGNYIGCLYTRENKQYFNNEVIRKEEFFKLCDEIFSKLKQIEIQYIL